MELLWAGVRGQKEEGKRSTAIVWCPTRTCAPKAGRPGVQSTYRSPWDLFCLKKVDQDSWPPWPSGLALCWLPNMILFDTDLANPPLLFGTYAE